MDDIFGVTPGSKMLTLTSNKLKYFSIYENSFLIAPKIICKYCIPRKNSISRYCQSINEQNTDHQFTEHPQKLK